MGMIDPFQNHFTAAPIWQRGSGWVSDDELEQ